MAEISGQVIVTECWQSDEKEMFGFDDALAELK